MRIFLRPSKTQMKLWTKLDSANVRRREGIFLAEGFKVTTELLASAWETQAILVMEAKRERWNTFLDGLPNGMAVYALTEREWEKLSKDKEPEGIMGLAAIPVRVNSLVASTEVKTRVPQFTIPREGHLLLLYEVGNPSNLGAILRTAHWFGISTVLLSPGSVDFTNPKVVRSSMGSLFHLELVPDIDFHGVLPALKKHCSLIAGEITGGISPHALQGRTAILLGSESHGLPADLLAMADERWCIMGSGGAESLSLPQAAAIIIYECTKK